MDEYTHMPNAIKKTQKLVWSAHDKVMDESRMHPWSMRAVIFLLLLYLFIAIAWVRLYSL